MGTLISKAHTGSATYRGTFHSSPVSPYHISRYASRWNWKKKHQRKKKKIKWGNGARNGSPQAFSPHFEKHPGSVVRLVSSRVVSSQSLDWPLIIGSSINGSICCSSQIWFARSFSSSSQTFNLNHYFFSRPPLLRSVETKNKKMLLHLNPKSAQSRLALDPQEENPARVDLVQSKYGTDLTQKGRANLFPQNSPFLFPIIYLMYFNLPVLSPTKPPAPKGAAIDNTAVRSNAQKRDLHKNPTFPSLFFFGIKFF